MGWLRNPRLAPRKVNTIRFVAIYRDLSLQGFLGGAGARPSTVWGGLNALLFGLNLGLCWASPGIPPPPVRGP